MFGMPTTKWFWAFINNNTRIRGRGASFSDLMVNVNMTKVRLNTSTQGPWLVCTDSKQVLDSWDVRVCGWVGWGGLPDARRNHLPVLSYRLNLYSIYCSSQSGITGGGFFFLSFLPSSASVLFSAGFGASSSDSLAGKAGVRRSISVQQWI